MAKQRRKSATEFKDYYEVLRLHPGADAAMVNQAYWHLARLHNAAIASDRSAMAKLDDLNEAYSVLGSPAHRKEYDRVRDAVLGEGALPTPPEPEPEPEPAPLSVMTNERPNQREDRQPQRPSQPRLNIRQLRVLPWRSVVGALIVLVLASAALLAGAHPAVVAALLVIGVVIGVAPKTFTLVRKLPHLPALLMPTLQRPAIRASELWKPRPARASIDPDAVRQSTKAMLGRWREGTEGLSTAESRGASPPQEPTLDNPDDERGPFVLT